MPPLDPDQYAALRADIEAHGIRVPVVVDQHGRVLDGNNRMAIGIELGIEVPTITQIVSDDDEAWDVALTLNLARRHLSTAQKRDLIAVELERNSDRSDRAIARLIGCDHKTVAAVRRGGEIPHPKVTRDEAEAHADAIRQNLLEAQDGFFRVVDEAMSNGIAAADLVVALYQRRRGWERHFQDDPPEAGRIVGYVLDPVIDYVIDPATTEFWRPHFEAPEFQPLTDVEKAGLLAAIGGAR